LAALWSEGDVLVSLPVLVGLIAAAFATSTISGILGMAGGVTLLGVMTALMPARDVVPLHGAVQLVSNGTRTLAFLRHVRWSLFGAYAPGFALGIGAGTLLASGLELKGFRLGIGLFLVAFVVWRRKAPRLRNLPRWTYVVVGLVSGLLALFVGATGPFIAPFFLRDDLAKEEVIGTKAACQALGHVLKFPAFVSLGYAYEAHLGLLAALSVAVVLGTLFGKRVLGQMKNATFVKLFEAVLVALAVYLIASGARLLAGA